jgi:hypothetical protein
VAAGCRRVEDHLRAEQLLGSIFVEKVLTHRGAMRVRVLAKYRPSPWRLSPRAFERANNGTEPTIVTPQAVAALKERISIPISVRKAALPFAVNIWQRFQMPAHGRKGRRRYRPGARRTAHRHARRQALQPGYSADRQRPVHAQAGEKHVPKPRSPRGGTSRT